MYGQLQIHDDEIVHHLLTLQGQFKSPKQMVCRPCLRFRFTTSNLSRSERGNHIRYQLRIRGRGNGFFVQTLSSTSHIVSKPSIIFYGSMKQIQQLESSSISFMFFFYVSFCICSIRRHRQYTCGIQTVLVMMSQL